MKPASALPADPRPLWQRMLLRRVKFLGVIVLLLGLALGGTYLFAPQWLLGAMEMRQAMAAHVEKHTLQVGDIRWSYYEGGTGPTLVLLHGFAADKGVWLPVAEQLTAHFHLLIPDLPGWGESSSVGTGAVTVEAQAARLHDFLQALQLQRFALVGHSMGGAIAAVYATAYPEQVASLALIDSYGLQMRENAFARGALAGHDPFVVDDRAGFARSLALVFQTPPTIPGRIADVWITRNQRNRAFIERSFKALSEPAEYLSVQHRLGQLQLTVLGLWCKNDQVMDISALDSLRNGLSHAPDISTSVLIGCNHMPPLEKPAETARILSGFALAH
jgi:abhydrolase domain-containing protein 6